jgi:hypothetical protein
MTIHQLKWTEIVNRFVVVHRVVRHHLLDRMSSVMMTMGMKGAMMTTMRW